MTLSPNYEAALKPIDRLSPSITSTLMVSYFVTFGRKVGNSTRICDHAIQLLFSGHKIQVQDHFENGTNTHSNKLLFTKIMNRLYDEHKLQVKDIEFDMDRLTIKLKDY